MKNIEQQLHEAVAILRGYEQWEADLINEDELWVPYREEDILQGNLYDKMMELQAKRNNFLNNILI